MQEHAVLQRARSECTGRVAAANPANTAERIRSWRRRGRARTMFFWWFRPGWPGWPVRAGQFPVHVPEAPSTSRFRIGPARWIIMAPRRLPAERHRARRRELQFCARELICELQGVDSSIFEVDCSVFDADQRILGIDASSVRARVHSWVPHMYLPLCLSAARFIAICAAPATTVFSFIYCPRLWFPLLPHVKWSLVG